MRVPRVVVGAALMLPILTAAGPAGAVVSSAESAGATLVSLKPAAAIATAGAGAIGVSAGAKSTWGIIGGTLIGLGGVALGVLDPPSATYYDGAFTIHYDPDQFKFGGAGWMGDWGKDPSLPPFPVDPADWGTSTTVMLQQPASGLSASIVNHASTGLIDVSFDWGASGHATGTGPLNIFGYVLEPTRPLIGRSLGMGTSPPPGANFFVSSASIHCSLTGDALIRLCGESQTEYFKVSDVPEPGSWALMILGMGCLGAIMRGRRASLVGA